MGKRAAAVRRRNDRRREPPVQERHLLGPVVPAPLRHRRALQARARIGVGSARVPVPGIRRMPKPAGDLDCRDCRRGRSGGRARGLLRKLGRDLALPRGHGHGRSGAGHDRRQRQRHGRVRDRGHGGADRERSERRSRRDAGLRAQRQRRDLRDDEVRARGPGGPGTGTGSGGGSNGGSGGGQIHNGSGSSRGRRCCPTAGPTPSWRSSPACATAPPTPAPGRPGCSPGRSWPAPPSRACHSSCAAATGAIAPSTAPSAPASWARAAEGDARSRSRQPSLSYLLPKRLGPGRYVLDVSALDAAGDRTAPGLGGSRLTFHVR